VLVKLGAMIMEEQRPPMVMSFLYLGMPYADDDHIRRVGI